MKLLEIAMPMAQTVTFTKSEKQTEEDVSTWKGGKKEEKAEKLTSVATHSRLNSKRSG